MLVKSQVKYIQSLGQKKFRDAYGAFVAEGPKIVSELLQSKRFSLIHCFATPSWILQNGSILSGRESLLVTVNEQELERISFHSSPNQVLAVFSKPIVNTDQDPAGLTILLDTIQDPGNLGTILRTADWFGVKKMICSMDCADLFSPKVVQSAMGSMARVDLIYSPLEEYILQHARIPVYASSLEGEDIQNKISVSGAFLLMGNESKGISESLEALAFKRIRIPRTGGAESLNVAVATGILLSQFILSN